ncbi:hypothetical protein BT96DRAFT_946806 [Gymnopus androsaceus JB14]|uniref:Uncharacterized protein n=1 Tax=Gymnopus androsaceus JB14 TaxID=1447944 RepID=A0A6A4GWP9_9AGAR|nr:hypothetical protein BT96DRAFT_946806 [Gymnopus androsaceus JB14]
MVCGSGCIDGQQRLGDAYVRVREEKRRTVGKVKYTAPIHTFDPMIFSSGHRWGAVSGRQGESQSSCAKPMLSKPFSSFNFTSKCVGAPAMNKKPSNEMLFHLSFPKQKKIEKKWNTTLTMKHTNIHKSNGRSFADKKRNLHPFVLKTTILSPKSVADGRRIKLALIKLNEYDPDSASDSLAPTGTFLASSMIILSLSPISPAPTASSLMHNLEIEAWELLNSYFTSDSDKGGEVHAALEKLGIGSEWENMWGRITALELGDADAGQSVREALDAMKPLDAQLSGAPTSVSNIVLQYNIWETLYYYFNSEAVELTQEQKALAEHINQFLDNVMLEEYGIYYISVSRKESEIIQCIQRDIKQKKHPQCLRQAFASRKQGGLYIRVHSMLDANYILAAYFHLTNGFLYSHQPVFLYVADNTWNGIAQKDNPGFNIPLLWKGPYLTMPIHHHVTGMGKLPTINKLPPFWPGVWVNTKKGLYHGNIGVVIHDVLNNLDNSECVVAFLPRLDLSPQNFKKLKKTHPSPGIPATSPTQFPVLTPMSEIKSKFDFVSINTKAGVYTAQADYLAGSFLAHTIANKDLLKFYKTESSVLQSTYHFLPLGYSALVNDDYLEIANKLGLQDKAEGYMTDIVERNCVVGFLDGNDREERLVSLPQHCLLKVMRQGDQVYVGLQWHKISQLGVVDVSGTIECISLNGKVRPCRYAPEPLNPAVHTGPQPWVGKEVQIVGLDDGGATVKHHKSEVGSILDVNCNETMPSGLAISNSITIWSFTFMLIMVVSEGPQKPPMHNPHFSFKPGYKPRYYQSDILNGIRPYGYIGMADNLYTVFCCKAGGNGTTLFLKNNCYWPSEEETKDRVITLQGEPGEPSTLHYKEKGSGLVQLDPQNLSMTKWSYGISSDGSHIGKLAHHLFGTCNSKFVSQVVKLEADQEETQKTSCTMLRYREIVVDGEPPIVVLESSIALVNQMPDEQRKGIQLMSERQMVAEKDYFDKWCPTLELTDAHANQLSWLN